MDRPDLEAKATATAATNVIGKTISFTAGGGSVPYRGSGWSQTEKDFTWTEGNSAKLALPISMDPGLLTLQMNLVGFVHPPKLEIQNVEVMVENQKLGDWQVSGSKSAFTVKMPAEFTKGRRVLEVELRLPNAISPESFGVSNDTRVLAVACASLELKVP